MASPTAQYDASGALHPPTLLQLCGALVLDNNRFCRRARTRRAATIFSRTAAGREASFPSSLLLPNEAMIMRRRNIREGPDEQEQDEETLLLLVAKRRPSTTPTTSRGRRDTTTTATTMGSSSTLVVVVLLLVHRASAFLFPGASADTTEQLQGNAAAERVLVHSTSDVKAPPTIKFESTHPCRIDPTWSESEALYKRCRHELVWTPRSALWEGHLNRFEHMVLSQCVHEQQQLHMARNRIAKELQQVEGAAAVKQDVVTSKLRGKSGSAGALHDSTGEARVVKMYPPGMFPPLLVQIENAWSEQDVAAMNSTATCVRTYHPDTHIQNRYFSEAGGNNVTYMAGFLQMMAPGVSAHNVNLVRMARAAAGWDKVPHPDPGTLGVRTNEHLLYTDGGQVGLHLDDESVYTLVVALSEPESYEGGEYILYDSDDNTKKTFIKLPRRSALVFLSDYTEHGVAPITKGTREMFAGEFWVEDDVPHTAMRPNIREYHEEVLGETFFDEAQGDL